MGALVGLIWHEDISAWLASWQTKVEEKTPLLINQGLDEAQNWWEEQGEGWADDFVAQLTSQGKEKIDQWLEEKNLNKYGNSKDTVYTGSNPLFNEATGERTDRHVYLLKKFPELIDDLNLEQYLRN